MQVVTSSGLCMRPRVHATFQLLTLGLAAILLDIKKEKTVRLIVLGRKITMHPGPVSGVSTLNIWEILLNVSSWNWKSGLVALLWIPSSYFDEKCCKLIGCQAKDNLLKTDKKTKYDSPQQETEKISLWRISNRLNACSVDKKWICK